MAVWYSLWSIGTLFPFWYVWTKKNLATLVVDRQDGVCRHERLLLSISGMQHLDYVCDWVFQFGHENNCFVKV
jgi:hypothetical protein